MKQHVSLGSVVLMVSLILPLAGRGQWVQTNGPYQGFISGFASHKGSLFACSQGGGVYKTENDSVWEPANSNLSISYDYSIFSDDSALVISTDNGIFKSSDAGDSWIETWGSLQNAPVSFASVDSFLFAASYSGLFLSTDNGSTWIIDSNGLPVRILYGGYSIDTIPDPVTAITSNGKYLWIATEDYGIYCSNDRGKSWIKNNSNLPNGRIPFLVTVDNIVFAFTDSGLYRSVNSTLWLPANVGLSGTLSCMTAEGGLIFAGTYNQDKLRGDGIFESKDSGLSWTPCDSSLTNLGVTALWTVDSTLFAGTKGSGVFISRTNGKNWEQSSNGIRNDLVNDLFATDQIIYTVGSYESGVYLSYDTGNTWIPIDSGLTDRDLLAISSSISSNGDTNVIVAGNSGNIYYSPNNGKRWFTADTSHHGEISNLLSVGSIALAPIYNGLLISLNYGQTWKVDSGFRGYPGQPGTAQAQITASDTLVYLGGYFANIHDTTKSGLNWKPINGPFLGGSLAFIGDTLFSNNGNIVVFSTNNGQDWQPTDSLPILGMVSSLTVSDSILFAEVGNNFAYTTNNGVKWNDISMNPNLYAIQAVAANTSTLFAGSASTGVWRRSISDILTRSSVSPQPVESAETLTAYPNPTTHSTTLHLTTPPSGNVTVTVVNPLGVCVMRNLYSVIRDGSVTLNLSGLSAGMYECVVQTDGKEMCVPILVE